MFHTAKDGMPPNLFEPIPTSNNKQKVWSQEFRDFVGRCLNPDPKLRNTATELLEVSEIQIYKYLEIDIFFFFHLFFYFLFFLYFFAAWIYYEGGSSG
jgi:hypothetical protein